MDSRSGNHESSSQSGSSSTASAPRQYVSISRVDSQSRSQSSSPTQPIIGADTPTRAYGTIETPLLTPSSAGQALHPSTSAQELGRPAASRPHSQERTPKKPPTIRRTSSKPYRGQEFSVDDDPAEIEEDKALRRISSTSRIGSRQQGTIRRRANLQLPALERVESEQYDGPPAVERSVLDINDPQSSENNGDDNGEDEDEDGNSSDAESFTLKDRQQAINQTHPFGIRIWKPALYKKLRSVEKTAEGDIHSAPGERVNHWIFLVNLLWTLFFGWWLALAALFGAVACFITRLSPDSVAYGKVFYGLAGYLFYPFGSFVRLETDENYAEEDEGEGRSISEYEQWQSGDIEHGRLFFGPVANRSLVGRRRSSLDSTSEHDSLLGRASRGQEDENPGFRTKRRLFGRGEWTIGRVVFYLTFYLLVGPLMLFVSLICWMLVFWIPMARVTTILFRHLRRHPLALSFHSDGTYTRPPFHPSSSILLCTYRAAGLKYWKYTIDGTNIFLINLLGVVVFCIFDYWVLHRLLAIDAWVSGTGFIFTLALLSVIPLAYFIGQAVASISAQSSMGLGAAINAFFSTVVEVFLYCVALTEGKSKLVEGSIIGSIFAGILFLPGLSMCFGATKRKTQRFNVKSASVTSTMLLFAVIAAFGPTLFYKIYGSHELYCHPCSTVDGDRDCRRCFFSQAPALGNRFFLQAVQPYSWFAAILLFLSYVIGLWFTLRTHAAIIWSGDVDEKKPVQQPVHESHTHKSQGTANGKHAGNSLNGSIRDSQMYARILGQSLKQVGLAPGAGDPAWEQHQSASGAQSSTPHVVPPKSRENHTHLRLPGLSDEQNELFVRQVTEVAATAAALAARDSGRHPRKPSISAHVSNAKQAPGAAAGISDETEEAVVFGEHHHPPSGGHDAPNWGRTKSTVVLLVATLLYAIIAEILVTTVDVVMESVDVDEKFLGFTLFALVPNTTEFLNAISFAMNGNIALSMEIGSAYALQVCLLQIPALVLFSAINSRFLDPSELLSHSFNLIFPQWDMITVILCVFLLSYVYGEGKSNYFKGSILLLTYLFVMLGFFLTRFSNLESMGVNPSNTLALGPGGVLDVVKGAKT